MSAAGLLAPAPAPAGAPPAPEYYPEEDEELESAEDEERSCRGRESDEGACLGSGLGEHRRGEHGEWGEGLLCLGGLWKSLLQLIPSARTPPCSARGFFLV